MSHCRNCGLAPAQYAPAQYAPAQYAPAQYEPAHYGPAQYGGPALPRWRDVSTLHVPLIVLLVADAGMALLLHVKWFAPLMFLMQSMATAVLMLIWLFRARHNAVGGKHQFSPPWSVAGWFVPLACAYIPMRVVLDTGRASTSPDRRTSVTVLVVLWWGSLLLSLFTGAREIRAERAESVAFIGLPGSTWASAVCLAVAALALASVVRRITVDQQRAFRPR
jgi:hypothetical protein